LHPHAPSLFKERNLMILKEIVASTRQRLKAEMENDSLLAAEERLAAWVQSRPQEATTWPFAASLKHPDRLGLIAEIKKASPSRGLIAPDFDPEKQAALYRDSQADCLSVLTEPQFFQGALEHMTRARAVAGKPVIRKDFIIDQFQIVQARLAGADCVLLIAAILSDWELRCFKSAARRYGMDALVEVHTEEEARRAVSNGCSFVGINNRDLNTFEVDLATTERLRKLLPDETTVVAESGVFTREDARRLREAGADALLVGESLMRSGNPSAAIEEILS
jgi:indole-3-glycerol phosphate synthase